MKRKPGDYIPINWDYDDSPWELVAGHVADEVAIETVRRETDWPPVGEAVKIARGYARWAPDQFGDSRLYFQSTKTRGSFAVTLICRDRAEPPYPWI